VSTPATGVAIEGRPSGSLVALFGLLGFSSGLPFLLFSAVLFLRLTQNGAGLGVVAFFAWVSLLPTFKFAWAPLLDRIGIPGFGRFWGRWRSWILLCQLGTVSSLAGMAWAAPDDNLGATALWAVLLAFWTTTLEAAADGWRVELAPSAESQAPLASAALWGYRSAMVAAGSGAVVIADHGGWGLAYLVIAIVAFTAFPVLAATRADSQASAGRTSALLIGIGLSIVVIGIGTLATALIGSVVLSAAASTGLNPKSNVTPGVLLLCALPFVLMILAIPRIRAMAADAAPLRSAALGPYLDFFRTYGYSTIGILAFVSLYRMGDVLTLTLSKPLVSVTGYSLTQIGIADGIPALAANIIGVGIGGWVAARFDKMWSLSLGAVFAALGNFGYVWLAHTPVSGVVLYVTTFADHFGNGLAAAVFVVYLSLLANPRYPACQYAFLSGFAFLLPRLLAGASAAIQREIGYDGFFVLSGVLSLAALPLLPLLRTRAADVRLQVPAESVP
jgi:PAT family beta-lactamase induction signal transducer AmpG